MLRLVADGLSNSQIAEQLFISRKTASVHVSNILVQARRGHAGGGGRGGSPARLGPGCRPTSEVPGPDLSPLRPQDWALPDVRDGA